MPASSTTFGTDSLVVLAEGLGEGEHTLRMQKRTEGEQGRTTLHAFRLARNGRLLPAPPSPGRHIEFIGNSLTCGYGTEGRSKDEPFEPETENCDKAFGCIVARYFGADYTLIAHSGRGAARNYGDRNTVSENTMADRLGNTFDESPLPAWNFTASPYRPDIIVINLGSNDFSTEPHPFARRSSRLPTRASSARCATPTATPRRYSAWPRGSGSRPSPSSATSAARPSYGTCTSRPCCRDTATTAATWGSSAHPNYTGQRKLAMLLIPYVSTLTGWEAEAKPIE